MTAVPWDQQNDEQRRRTLAAAKRRADLHAHPAWPLIRAIARSLGWPKAFEADLYVHDRDVLARVPVDRPFLWAIGETGTYLHWLDDPGRVTRADARETVEILVRDRPSMHYWDGRALWSCTEYDARAVLAGVRFGDLEAYV